MHYFYVIIPNDQISSQILKDCLETDFTTLRRSVDDTKAILKYVGTKPISMTSYQEYTYDQIIALTATSEWVKDIVVAK